MPPRRRKIIEVSVEEKYPDKSEDWIQEWNRNKELYPEKSDDWIATKTNFPNKSDAWVDEWSHKSAALNDEKQQKRETFRTRTIDSTLVKEIDDETKENEQVATQARDKAKSETQKNKAKFKSEKEFKLELAKAQALAEDQALKKLKSKRKTAAITKAQEQASFWTLPAAAFVETIDDVYIMFGKLLELQDARLKKFVELLQNFSETMGDLATELAIYRKQETAAYNTFRKYPQHEWDQTGRVERKDICDKVPVVKQADDQRDIVQIVLPSKFSYTLPWNKWEDKLRSCPAVKARAKAISKFNDELLKLINRIRESFPSELMQTYFTNLHNYMEMNELVSDEHHLTILYAQEASRPKEFTIDVLKGIKQRVYTFPLPNEWEKETQTLKMDKANFKVSKWNQFLAKKSEHLHELLAKEWTYSITDDEFRAQRPVFQHRLKKGKAKHGEQWIDALSIILFYKLDQDQSACERDKITAEYFINNYRWFNDNNAGHYLKDIVGTFRNEPNEKVKRAIRDGEEYVDEDEISVVAKSKEHQDYWNQQSNPIMRFDSLEAEPKEAEEARSKLLDTLDHVVTLFGTHVPDLLQESLYKTRLQTEAKSNGTTALQTLIHKTTKIPTEEQTKSDRLLIDHAAKMTMIYAKLWGYAARVTNQMFHGSRRILFSDVFQTRDCMRNRVLEYNFAIDEKDYHVRVIEAGEEDDKKHHARSVLDDAKANQLADDFFLKFLENVWLLVGHVLDVSKMDTYNDVTVPYPEHVVRDAHTYSTFLYDQLTARAQGRASDFEAVFHRHLMFQKHFQDLLATQTTGTLTIPHLAETLAHEMYHERLPPLGPLVEMVHHRDKTENGKSFKNTLTVEMLVFLRFGLPVSGTWFLDEKRSMTFKQIGKIIDWFTSFVTTPPALQSGLSSYHGAVQNQQKLEKASKFNRESMVKLLEARAAELQQRSHNEAKTNTIDDEQELKELEKRLEAKIKERQRLEKASGLTEEQLQQFYTEKNKELTALQKIVDFILSHQGWEEPNSVGAMLLGYEFIPGTADRTTLEVYESETKRRKEQKWLYDWVAQEQKIRVQEARAADKLPKRSKELLAKEDKEERARQRDFQVDPDFKEPKRNTRAQRIAKKRFELEAEDEDSEKFVKRQKRGKRINEPEADPEDDRDREDLEDEKDDDRSVEVDKFAEPNYTEELEKEEKLKQALEMQRAREATRMTH